MRTTDGYQPAASLSRRWAMRGLLVVLALVFGLVVCGMIYESVMAAGDSSRFPAPGHIVEVNGQAMHIHCVGTGDVTVVFEAGFGAWSDAWTQVQPNVGTFTQACSYDRAGLGWSAPSSQARTPEQIAQDLHELLQVSGVQPPYILVGHSIGGKSIRLFTAQYPNEVSGLIFLDARHESVEPVGRTTQQAELDQEAWVASFNLHRTLRQLGVVRVMGVPLARSMNPALGTQPDDLVYRLAMFGVRETTIQTMIVESADSAANDDDLRTMQLPAGLPVTVLTASASLSEAGWETAQQQLAGLTQNSEWIIVPNSTHHIQDDQPEAVIDAIRVMLTKISPQ